MYWHLTVHFLPCYSQFSTESSQWPFQKKEMKSCHSSVPTSDFHSILNKIQTPCPRQKKPTWFNSCLCLWLLFLVQSSLLDSFHSLLQKFFFLRSLCDSLHYLGASQVLSGKESTPVQETQKTQVQSSGWGDSLEEEMAIHCSILAWEIPQTEGYSPWGCRIGNAWATKHSLIWLKSLVKCYLLKEFLLEFLIQNAQLSSLLLCFSSKHLPLSNMQ